MKFSYSKKLGKYVITEHGIVIDSDEDSQALRQRHNFIETEPDDQQMLEDLGVNEPTQEYWETVIWPMLQPPEVSDLEEAQVVAGIVYGADDPVQEAQAIADILLDPNQGQTTGNGGDDEQDALEVIKRFLEQ